MSLSEAKHLAGKYRLTLLALAVIAGVVFPYWETFSRIVEMWSISDYQYGWFVYPLCLYILAKKREHLVFTQWQTSVSGLLLLILLVLFWLVSRAVGVQALEFASATLLIFALYWCLAGTEAMRVLAFPLLLLLASVPMGGFLSEPLMRLTAEIASVLLSFTGVPVFREGQFFELPGGSFEVAEICNGFRYLLASTQISLVYAYLTYSQNLKRLVFILSVAFVMVITNGVRAFIVMYVASATNMRILGGYDHVVFGMIMFAGVFLLMIWIGERYADPEEAGRQPVDSDRKAPAVHLSILVAVVAFVVLLAAPVFATVMSSRDPIVIADLPLPALEPCSVPRAWESEAAPAFHRPDFERNAILECGDYDVGVYVASYSLQEQGRELVAWNNQIWPYEWRRYADESIVELEIGGESLKVREVLLRHPGGWSVMWHWYHVGPWKTSSETGVKILEAVRAITLRQSESSVVVVAAISEDEDNAQMLRDKLRTHASELLHWNDERIESGSQK